MVEPVFSIKEVTINGVKPPKIAKAKLQLNEAPEYLILAGNDWISKYIEEAVAAEVAMVANK